jgi:hypothetical protein
VKPVQLGPIGQPDAVELNDKLKKIIPMVCGLLEESLIKPRKHTVEGDSKVWEVQTSGKSSGTKTVVKVGGE